MWYLNLDGAGRIPFFLLVLLLVCNSRDVMQFAFVSPSKIYFAIGIYMVFNGILMGSASTYSHGGLWIIITHILGPVFSMLIVICCSRKDFDTTTAILSWGLMLYCVLSIINSRMNAGRLNSEINANEMAMYGAITIMLFLYRYIRGSIKKYSVILLSIPILLVILTGSRMGFLMVALIIGMTIIIKVNFSKPRTILKAIAFFIIAYFVIDFIVQNTLLGERLLNTTKDSDSMSALKTGTILDYYGDRGFQYYYSWQYFKDNPIYGIGFHKWLNYSPTGHVCHSEFMVQYVECGLLAFIPWLFFWYLLFKPLHIVKKRAHGMNGEMVILLICSLVLLLYADTVLWSYNIYCVFIIYAIAISYPRNLGYV